ncbi:MAG: ZIP family metal transporter [Candidatus Bathyarchaeota archaeon]|jgi:zinc and cadmium transporter
MLLLIIAISFLISLIAFVGVVSLAIKDEVLDRILLYLVGFAAGALIGGAFLHLLPEAVERSTSMNVFLALSFGFLLFFLLEKLIWRHCHKGKCEVHPFAYVNLIGDGIHNFIDGLVMATSFLSGIQLGIVTSLAVAFHEIPQEIGDFGVLVYGGLRKSKALILNFSAGLTAIIGGLVGYFLQSYIGESMIFILPFAAGGFIYIAASDLIPELHKEVNPRRSLASFAVFLLGFAFMLFVKLYSSS